MSDLISRQAAIELLNRRLIESANNNVGCYEDAGVVFEEIATERFGLSQEAKADAGKPRLTLVPRKIIWDIAEIREYGCRKYNDPENWRKVEPQRYRDAAMRHMMRYLDDPDGNDDESGLPHLWHLACNIAFLCEMEGEQHDNTGNL